MKVFQGSRPTSNRLKKNRDLKKKDQKKFTLEQPFINKEKNRGRNYSKSFFKPDDSGIFSKVTTSELLNRRKMERSYLEQLNFNTRRAHFDDLLKKYRQNRQMAVEYVEEKMAVDFDLKRMIYVDNAQLLENIEAHDSGSLVSYYI